MYMYKISTAHRRSQFPYLWYIHERQSCQSPHLVYKYIKDCRLKRTPGTRIPIARAGYNPAEDHRSLEIRTHRYSSNVEMGDPLSIAASVAGLITISAQIVGMAKELFGKVKDAPDVEIVLLRVACSQAERWVYSYTTREDRALWWSSN